MKILTLLTLQISLTVVLVQAKPYLEFDDQIFRQAFHAGNEQEKVWEFLREGDSLQNWSKMVSKRNFPNLDSPKDYVANLESIIRSNPMNMCEVYRKGRIYMIDFLVHAPDFSFAEWNLMKVEKTKEGLVVWQYAYRLTGSDWADHLKSERSRIGKILGKAKIEIKEDGQEASRNPDKPVSRP